MGADTFAAPSHPNRRRSNAAGQLGNGGFASASAFVPVSGGLTFASIAAGGSHSCGLTAAGAAYCWGSGAYGQLGNGQSGPTYNVTAPVPAAGGLAFASISAGVDHTCALTAAGKPYCWGASCLLGVGLGATGLPLAAAAWPSAWPVPSAPRGWALRRRAQQRWPAGHRQLR